MGAQYEGGGIGSGTADSDEALRAAEAEAFEVRERLRTAEEKLLDAQSVRDMFAKETDMFRSELKVAREERVRLEEELTHAQERVRELQALHNQADPTAAQQSVIQTMQKDFEGRMERYRDEVQYLRQKCDEKDRRCEHLLAAIRRLTVELRGAGGCGAWRTNNEADANASDLEGGSVAKPVSTN